MSKRYTIELTEKQLEMIDAACELKARLINGQLYVSDFQDLVEEAWEIRHPNVRIGSDDWCAMREELEETLKLMQFRYWGYSPGQSGGVGQNDYADILWDIHKSCEHARYLSMPEKEREELKWTVMADTPMAYGDEPLITIKEI